MLHTYIHIYVHYVQTFHAYLATVICFSESTLIVNEDQGLVPLALTLTNPLSTGNFTVELIKTDRTTTGEDNIIIYVFYICMYIILHILVICMYISYYIYVYYCIYIYTY